jgi:hypothetical protein
VAGSTFAPLASGVWADTSSVDGEGLLATADQGAAAYFYNSSSDNATVSILSDLGESMGAGLLEVASEAGGACDIDNGGNLECSGTVTNVVRALSTGQQVQTYSMQAAENWYEDAGTAQLEQGVAHVDLEPVFNSTVNTGVEYHVFLTPDGDCKGLYVSHKSSGGFDVRELGGGKSSIPFDYRIMAKRVGYEDLRLKDVTEKSRKMAQRLARMHRPETTAPQFRPAPRLENMPGGSIRRVPHIQQSAPKSQPISGSATAKTAGNK